MGEQSQAAEPAAAPAAPASVPAPAPSAAPPSAAAEGGAGEDGGSMPLIIGGAVVMLLLVSVVGAYFLLSGKDRGGDRKTNRTDPIIPDKSGGLDPSKWTYFGVLIGDLQDAEHGVSGKVYAATENVFCLNEFNYDGAGPSVAFMVGTTDSPDGNGEELIDITIRPARRSSGPERLQARNLKKYSSERVILKPSKPIIQYKYLSVYSKDEKKSYGHVKIENFKAPAQQVLAPFENTLHDIKSSKNTLLDSKRIEIKGFHIDYQAPATYFSVGNGARTIKNAIKIDEEALQGLSGVDFVLSLPEDKTWDQYEWFSAFCYNAQADLGSFDIPRGAALTVPVYFNTNSGRRRGALQRRVRLKNLRTQSESGPPKLLACTFGEFGVKRAMVPSDGMCDVVFYTDVEYDTDTETIVPRDGGSAFEVLKSAAKKYAKTTFGTSMSTGAIADAVQDNTAELTASMDELFRDRFIHFGMLNVENIEDYDTLKTADLRYMKVIADFLKAKMQHRRYHSALGISLRDGSNGGTILEVAERAPHDFPGLTMIVVKLHSEGVRSSGDRWPVAPNPDGADLSEHNELSLAAIKDEVKKRLNDVARHGRYAMLSFAMYVRTYQMKASWAEVSVREMSVSSLNMDYAEVCKMKAAKDSSDAGTMYAADQQKKFLALFDSPVTFKAKTKARLHVMPKNFTGLMVYNVEMDDYKGTCGKGRFPRLKAIKEALVARP